MHSSPSSRTAGCGDQVRGCATYARVLAGDDDLLQRRGRGLLRRAPAAGSRSRSTRRCTRSSTSSCPATARCSNGGRRGASVTAARATGRSPCSTTWCRSCGRARPGCVELPGRRGADARAGRGRAVVGVQLLPGQPPQPGRAEHRRADLRARPAAPRRARGLPRPPHRARGQGAAAAARPGPHRGGDPARADAAGAS